MPHKNKSKSGAAMPAVALGAALEGPAEAALVASRFKEAIEHFKGLLKRERRPAWLAGLAAAYAGRAEQLVGKGMIKEALALWRTRADACGVPVLAGPYVDWLLQSGEVEQVLALLRRGDALTPQVQARIQNQLAPAVLVAPETLLAGVPADSPLLRHRAAAQAALAAVVHADDAALAQALQAIAFRSPYRDLRPLLKALALLRTDPELAATALARVADAGPFGRLAAALRVAVLPAHEWLAGLRRLDEPGRLLVLELAGCPEPQRAVVMELALAVEPKPAALFDLVARHRRVLPESLARELCLRLLPHAPARLDNFHSAFGPLPRAERERIMALAGELKPDHDLAMLHWLKFVDQSCTNPPEHRRAALVLRHLADDRHFHDDDSTGPALKWLEQSLEFDPTDREAELRLLRGLRERGDLKRVRARLDAALARFPDDAAMLLEAVETALAGAAFKKAIVLAKQVLKLDPINPRVRSVIGQAHLSHARKQIDARNPKAAQRELGEARSWLRGTAELATLGLLRGLVAQSPADGDALLRQALAELGGSLVGSFHLAVEAERARVAARTVLQRAGADLDATPGAAHLVALAHALNAARSGDRAVRLALDAVRPMLQRAAADNFGSGSESEQALVCEALHRQAQPDLTRRFAAAALRRWPGKPTFVYFDVAARYQGEAWRIPWREQQRLEKALEQAQAQGDRRGASRLADLLDQAGGGFGRFELPDEDATFPDGPGGSVRGVLDIILAAGGEAQFLDLARRQLGRATFDQLRRDIGGSNKQFVKALMELMAIAEQVPKLQPIIIPAKPAPQRREPPADKTQKGLFDD